MKNLVLLVLPLVAILGIATAGEDPTTNVSPQHAGRFVVTVSEYQLEKVVSPTSTEAEILELIRSKEILPVETVRLAVMNGLEGMAKFGKRFTVTVGESTNNGLTTRQSQFAEIGTLLKVTLTAQDNRVIAKVSFESSRVQGGEAKGQSPDFVTSTLSTTQSFELGKPSLLGSTSQEKTSYVFLTVTKQP